MTKKRSIDDFLEQMDHEFPKVDIQLDRQGYKVDGNDGIKKHCDLNTLKSVDYFCQQPIEFLLVEFSDLARQQAVIIEQVKALKSSDLAANLKKRLIVDHHKQIHKELVSKYKDSIHIQSQINKHISHIPEVLLGENRRYMIVVAPIEQTLPEDKKIEMIRFFDDLQNKVSQSIPDAIHSAVKVLPVSVFGR